MDYFDANFNTDDTNRYQDLPEGFEWEEMKDGIYKKRKNSSFKNPKRYWPLMLLLLLAGCGTGSWMAMEYFNTNEVEDSIVLKQEQSKGTKKTSRKPSVQKKDIHNNLGLPKTIKSKSKTNDKKDAAIDVISSSKSTTSNTLISKQPLKPLEIEVNEKQNIYLNKNQSFSSNTTHTNDSTTAQDLSIPTGSLDRIESLSAIPFSRLEAIPYLIDSKLKRSKSGSPKSKSYIEWSIAGGLSNWAAFDKDNLSHDYVSGYPGWSINPSISFFLKSNHAIQVDYEYTAFEELFNYTGSRPIHIHQEDVVVKEVINSLTGDLTLSIREDVLLNGIRKYREVKYNQFQLHTLSLGYRFYKKINAKTNLGIYSGVSYLFSLHSKGKRLNEQLDIIAFDKSNPLFRGNQLGLRLGLSYNFKISKNTTLFSQILATKYVTNWELQNSTSATRPLVYGIQVGLRRNIMK